MAVTVDVQRITGAGVRTFDDAAYHVKFSTVEIRSDGYSDVTLFFDDENHAERARKIAEAINAK